MNNEQQPDKNRISKAGLGTVIAEISSFLSLLLAYIMIGDKYILKIASAVNIIITFIGVICIWIAYYKDKKDDDEWYKKQGGKL